MKKGLYQIILLSSVGMTTLTATQILGASLDNALYIGIFAQAITGFVIYLWRT
jgi:hypothetical protein